jgi:hypothetical protein
VPEPTPQARRVLTAGALSGCTCDATGCKFVECRDETPHIEWQLTGLISVTGEWTTFDLSFTDPRSRWRLTGGVVLAPDRADGALSWDQVIQGQGSVSVDVGLRDVVVDDTKCPIGGTYHGDMDVDLRFTSGVTLDFHVAGELSFGPTCQL